MTVSLVGLAGRHAVVTGAAQTVAQIRDAGGRADATGLASDAAAMITGVVLPVDGGNLALNAGGTIGE